MKTVRGVVRLASLAAALTAGTQLVGCRVDENDIKRWETTVHGPTKLVAVIEHDKYAMPLRTDAAMTLVAMPPRGGVRRGVQLLTGEYNDEDGNPRQGALVGLSPETRKQIVNGMAPELIKEMQAAPPARKEGDAIPADPSVPYKDAAYAMLSHDPTLVTDTKTHDDLVAALVTWSQTDFEDRIDNPGQQFGVEQTMRYLGASSVKGLPALINENTYRLDRIVGLIADIGDADTKTKGSQALVDLATKLESQQWVDATTKMVDQHNKDAKVSANPQQLAQQVSKMQDSKLSQDVFPAMRRLGGKPVIAYLLGYAANTNGNKDRRKLALAALEGHVDKSNQADVDKLFAIAKDDSTPDEVRDIAFQRLGELPKEMLVPRLYSYFDNKKWKVRWVAASLVLKTLTPKDVPEFMNHLPQTPLTPMGMNEPVGYGALLLKMETAPPPGGGPKIRDVLQPYFASKATGPKLAALGFFYDGKKKDVPAAQAYANDPSPLPKCAAGDECGWECQAAVPGQADKQTKPISTFGEFVSLCVIPSMDHE
jgi:hypothetical protein